MKVVIKCSTTREMWNDLILSHEGPSKTMDTKIAALRLKFNAFKALEDERVKETYTGQEILLNELENKDVKIAQAEDTRSSNEFLVDLNVEFHDRALLIRIGVVAESFDWDEESLSSEDEGTTTVKAFMAIVEDEPVVGKTYC
ncbi:hypothetical protein Tco_0002529 [Tanacetum coccineum]